MGLHFYYYRLSKDLVNTDVDEISLKTFVFALKLPLLNLASSGVQIHDLTKPVGRLLPRTDERNRTGNCPEVHPLDRYLSGERPIDNYLSGEHPLDSYVSGEHTSDSYLSGEQSLDTYLSG